MQRSAGQHAAVSVIVPVKDRAELLAVALRSVGAQTQPVAEVIVVDDGSRDESARVAESLGATVVRNDGASWGPARARNAGLEHATGDWVNFLDSDDLLFPRAIELLRARVLEGSDASFAFGRAFVARWSDGSWAPDSVIRPDGEARECSAGAIYRRDSVPSGGTLVRAELLRRLGGYDPELEYGEDHDLWVRLALEGPALHVPELVLLHRRHVQNRQTPTVLLEDHAGMMQLGRSHEELQPFMAAKTGVELCEVVIDSAKLRRPGRVGGAIWRLLLRQDGRRQVLSSASRHYRSRRRARREGLELWERSADLRDWLRAQ